MSYQPSGARGDYRPRLNKADNLILWIGDNQTTPLCVPAYHPKRNRRVARHPSAPQEGQRLSRVGMAKFSVGFKGSFTRQSLVQAKEIQTQFKYQLTLAGWEKYAALKKERRESRTAFMALKFGLPDVICMVERVRPTQQ